MNNRELFIRAHALAKEVHVSNSGESYAVTFGACLKLIRAENTVGAKVDTQPVASKIGEGKNLYVATNKLRHTLDIAWITVQVALLTVATWYAAQGWVSFMDLLLEQGEDIVNVGTVIGMVTMTGLYCALTALPLGLWAVNLEEECKRVRV